MQLVWMSLKMLSGLALKIQMFFEIVQLNLSNTMIFSYNFDNYVRLQNHQKFAGAGSSLVEGDKQPDLPNK